MNTFKRTIYFLIAGLIIFSISCKSKDCHEDGSCAPDYRKMPLGEAKSYLYALPGSYWIYQNTKTFELDTQVCIDFLCDTVISKGEDRAKYITIEYERIKRTIKSSFNQVEYYDETDGYNASAPRDPVTIVDRWSGVDNIETFIYPFNINSKASNGASITTCMEFDSVLIIQGRQYKNVAKFDVDLDGNDEIRCQHLYIQTSYYWAQDIGIVKKTIKDCNYSWELIDFKIIH